MRKQKVLFLCTQNSARSQMAEGFLRHLAGDRFEVYSAGIDPTDEIHPCPVEAMSEVGIDISEQYPKGARPTHRGASPGRPGAAPLTSAGLTVLHKSAELEPTSATS